MGLNIFRTKKPASGSGQIAEVRDLASDDDVRRALEEFQIRELSFWSCVNFVADLVGRCEMRTYVNHAEMKGNEYWLWNYEPNVNQNAVAFWHKAVAKLYEDNECLIIRTRRRDGLDAFVVADSWFQPEHWPAKQNEYQGVTVGDMQYSKTFYEDDVLHLQLNYRDMKPVIDAIAASYMKLVQAAMRAYGWENGQHWKVHVNQMASAADGWLSTFQQMMENQIKPFMESPNAILPEFDGYDFVNLREKDGSRAKDTRDIKAMIEDILLFTARAVGVDAVLIGGSVEATGDAMKRTLTRAVDPICDQASREWTRKRCGLELWRAGTYYRMSSAAIEHFSLFNMAASIEKLMGSGWSFNNIRRSLGEETIDEPWADQHFITKNFGASEQMSAQEGAENAQEGAKDERK